MVNLAILGCCCSRDIFRVDPAGVKIVLYHAGSSLISLLSNPVPIREEDIQLTDRFERRVVRGDFAKTFLTDLPATQAEYLLIDLMYEGPDLAKVGSSYVTKSGSMLQSRIEETSGLRFTPVERDGAEARELWAKACPEFISRLQAVFPADRVILHQAVWFPRYREKGKTHFFNPEEMARIGYRNQIINGCYADFMALWPGIHSLDLRDHGYVASADHPWGLAPHHYEEAYYRRAAAAIRRITSAGHE